MGLTAGSAAAASLRVRIDPNDSSSNLDIHKVITNLSATTMYLRLNSWDRFRINDMHEAWGFHWTPMGRISSTGGLESTPADTA